MTKEEIIKIAKGLITDFKCDSDVMVDFCNSIITLLEQQPCEDCIDRQEVKKFVEYIQTIKDNHNEKGSPINYGTICDIVIKAHKLLDSPSVTPVQKWIPCSERLPEERGYYIVTEKVFSIDDKEHKGKYNTMVEQVEYCNGKWKRASFFEVIAWIPLPPSYQGE